MVPVALSVNQEPRQEALQYLTLFKCEMEDEEHTAYSYDGVDTEDYLPMRGMYINYKLDWICIDSLEFLNSHFTDRQKHSYQLLVVYEYDTELAGYIVEKEDLQDFKALRKLHLVEELQNTWQYVLDRKAEGESSALDLLKHKFNSEDDNDDRFQKIPPGIERLRKLWGEAWVKRAVTGNLDITMGGTKFVAYGTAGAGNRVIGAGDEVEEEEVKQAEEMEEGKEEKNPEDNS